MKRARSARRTNTVPTTPAATMAAAASAAGSVTVPVLAPRNPYQQLARQRKGGAHDVDTRKRRRIENNELRRRVAED